MSLEQELVNDIQTLSSSVWRKKADGRTIEQWLQEFGAAGQPGSRGRLHALYLLSRFMFFGDEEIRELLRALFRDHFKYPIIAQVRRQAGDTRDVGLLAAAFDLALSRARFLGMGNPSESGTHLLYLFRQVNGISRTQFIGTHEVFDWSQPTPSLADPTVTRYVFIDDFCGSGEQAVRYSKGPVARMKAAALQANLRITVAYHVLLATQKGLQRVRTQTTFDEVACVMDLDDSFRAFEAGSRYFRSAPSEIDRDFAANLAAFFGVQLQRDAPLGYDNGQLMLGFSHNTPDNVLPIFWHPGHPGKAWHPIFPRYHKF